jgi:hypothetical protein
MLVIYVNSRLNRRRRGEGRKLLLIGSSLPFSPLLQLSREFSYTLKENRNARSWESIAPRYMNVESDFRLGEDDN